MSGKVFHTFKFSPGFELLGSWERSKKTNQIDFPEMKSYASIDELLADGLIVVNTPVETHYEYAKSFIV
jgi:predicted dehydrogenase